MTNPEIDIILCTHNHLEMTIVAVMALYEHTSTPFLLTVIDDSTDLTPQWFEEFSKEHDNIYYIRPEEPLTCNNQIMNIGIAQTECEFIVYLGNSTKVEPQWLDAPLHFIRQYPEVGVVGFKNLFPQGTIEHAGIYFIPGMPNHMNFGLGEAGHRHTYVREVDMVGWSLALLRRKALPPEGFGTGYYIGFRGYEDIDNCLEMKKNGWSVLYCGFGASYHYAWTTRGDIEKEKHMQEYEENRFRFLTKWGVPPKEKVVESSTLMKQ